MATPPEQDRNPPPVQEILSDWDGTDLMEGVRKLAAHYPSKSLKEWLELTSIAETYRNHHKQNRLDD